MLHVSLYIEHYMIHSVIAALRLIGLMGPTSAPVFRRLCAKVHQIMSSCVEEIAVCNAVFRLSVSFPFWSYSESKSKILNF